MKYQVLFSLKNNEKVFINVVISALSVNCRKHIRLLLHVAGPRSAIGRAPDS